jgi:hypothetical protein
MLRIQPKPLHSGKAWGLFNMQSGKKHKCLSVNQVEPAWLTNQFEWIDQFSQSDRVEVEAEIARLKCVW